MSSLQFVTWEGTVGNRTRRCSVVVVALLCFVWLLMMLWVQGEDYADGSYASFPDQFPVYAATTVLVVYDWIAWWRCLRSSREVKDSRHDKAISSTTAAAGNDEEDDVTRSPVPRRLVLLYLLAFFLHVVEAVYWTVQWGANPDRLGENDWGARITMSKAMGHWLTLPLLSAFVGVRLAFHARP